MLCATSLSELRISTQSASAPQSIMARKKARNSAQRHASDARFQITINGRSHHD